MFSLSCILSLIQNSTFKYFFVARYPIYAFWVFHARSLLKMQFCDFIFSHFNLYFLINHTPLLKKTLNALLLPIFDRYYLEKKEWISKILLRSIEGNCSIIFKCIILVLKKDLTSLKKSELRSPKGNVKRCIKILGWVQI